ncbi:MAG: hypothetical protein ACRELY_19725, partial [Polyangiaceae bacterium]
LVFVLIAATPFFFACKVEHDGSFEHDAGFVAMSASVAVQIGHPPPTAASASASAAESASATASSSMKPIGPPEPSALH